MSAISLPKINRIDYSAFKGCTHLISLYLLGSSVPELVTLFAFSSTPLYDYSVSAERWGSIYVRASLYNNFITANNWSYMSSHFVSLTDTQIAALE